MQSYLDVDAVTIAYPRGSIVTEAVRGVTFGIKRQEFVVACRAVWLRKDNASACYRWTYARDQG